MTKKHAIILIMKDVEFQHFRQKLPHSLQIIHVQDKNSLEKNIAILTKKMHVVRIIGFCTSLIVSQQLLHDVNFNAYNLHPGPPNYPGVHPQGFALLHKQKNYGVVLHQMAAKPDSGVIIDSLYFPIKPQCSRGELDIDSYIMAARLLEQHLPKLADVTTPLTANGEIWGSTTYTNKDLCNLPPHLIGCTP